MVKSIAKSAGAALVAYLLVNLVYFLIVRFSTEQVVSESFKHGQFRVNGELASFPFDSFPGVLIVGLVFGYVLLMELRKPGKRAAY